MARDLKFYLLFYLANHWKNDFFSRVRYFTSKIHIFCFLFISFFLPIGRFLSVCHAYQTYLLFEIVYFRLFCFLQCDELFFFVQVFGGKAFCAPIHDMIFTSYFHSIFTRHNNNNNNNIGKQFQEQICAHLANQTEKWKEWERKVAIAQSTLTSWMRKCFSTEYNNHKRPSQKRKAIINIFAFPFWFRLHLVSVHYLFV